MFNSTKRYYDLNTFLRNRHHEKVIKISIDGGFTCPNRDGTLSKSGCIFCNAEGSGEFTPSAQLSISKQLEMGRQLLSEKWPQVTQYIAYFQAYTNTYAPLDILKAKYEEALSFPGVCGLALATRPDCLDNATLDYLEDLSKRTHLWVELGLQTIHPKSAQFINRGYDLNCFEACIEALHHRNIEVVVHLILGLPTETSSDMLSTVDYLSQLPLQGVKLHMLNLLDNAPLARYYEKHPFNLLTLEEYVPLVCEILTHLPKNFVIHRLTGDGDANHLIAPLWVKNKRLVLNSIERYLKVHDLYQGKSQNVY